MAKNEIGRDYGRIGAGLLSEVSFLASPERCLIREEIPQSGGERLFAVCQSASPPAMEKFKVALLLAGDEMVNEHRGAGGERFMDGGPSGLADDEMMGSEELGNALGPGEDAHPPGIGFFHLTGTMVELAEVSSEDDGDLRLISGVIEKGAGDSSYGRAFGGWEEEDAKFIQ